MTDSSRLRYDRSWDDFREYLRRVVSPNVYSLVARKDFESVEDFLSWIEKNKAYSGGRRSVNSRYGDAESMPNLLRRAYGFYQDRISATRVKLALRPFFSKSYKVRPAEKTWQSVN